MRGVWMYGLIPEAMSMGVSSILLPVYIILNLGGNAFDVGLVAAVTSFTLIPALIFWGYLVDKFQRCKVFMEVSFMGMGISFFLLATVSSVFGLLVIVALRSVFYAASQPARNILTIESSSRSSWEWEIARLQLVTGFGEGIGLAFAAVFTNISLQNLLFTCGFLSLATSILSIWMIKEPSIMIERKLLSIGRFVDTLSKASSTICLAVSGSMTVSSYDSYCGFKPKITFFTVGVFVFALGGATLFTTLPVIYLGVYSSSLVFILFFVKSIANTLSYAIAGRITQESKSVLKISSISRIILIPILLASFSSLIFSSAILALLGVIWALFDVASTTLFLELAPQGRAGIYGALIELGNGLGGLIGGYVTLLFGINLLFGLCSLIYLFSLFAFLIQFHR